MKDWRRSPEPPGMMGPGPAEGLEEVPIATRDVDPVPTAAEVRTSMTGAQRGKVQPLAVMCKRVIMRNLNSVTNLGDMPYRIAREILEQCRVDQLIEIEENSPHLMADTDEIWHRNCLRDFIHVRKQSEAGTLKAPKSWRKLYLKTLGKNEAAKAAAAQRIKEKYAKHKSDKEAKKLVVSDKPLARMGGPRRGGAPPWAATMGSSSSGKMSTADKGKSMLNKARSGSAAQARLTTTAGPSAFSRFTQPLGQVGKPNEAVSWSRRAAVMASMSSPTSASSPSAVHRTRVESSSGSIAWGSGSGSSSSLISSDNSSGPSRSTLPPTSVLRPPEPGYSIRSKNDVGPTQPSFDFFSSPPSRLSAGTAASITNNLKAKDSTDGINVRKRPSSVIISTTTTKVAKLSSASVSLPSTAAATSSPRGPSRASAPFPSPGSPSVRSNNACRGTDGQEPVSPPPGTHTQPQPRPQPPDRRMHSSERIVGTGPTIFMPRNRVSSQVPKGTAMG